MACLLFKLSSSANGLHQVYTHYSQDIVNIYLNQIPLRESGSMNWMNGNSKLSNYFLHQQITTTSTTLCTSHPVPPRSLGNDDLQNLTDWRKNFVLEVLLKVALVEAEEELLSGAELFLLHEARPSAHFHCIYRTLLSKCSNKNADIQIVDDPHNHCQYKSVWSCLGIDASLRDFDQCVSTDHFHNYSFRKRNENISCLWWRHHIP